MAGFDIYPDKDRTSGMRSKYLLNNGAIANLSYNGYHFPPAVQSRITIVPEYDRSERVVKYLTIAIEIQFIFTDPRGAPEDLGIQNTSFAQISYPSARDLIARLNQPGQALHFNAQGLGGSFAINDAGNTNLIKDLDNGPKPQVTEMQPLGGGNAFMVNWLCVSRVSPLLDNYIGDFVEFNYGVEWTLDNAGFMVRNVQGLIEFDRYQFTQPGADQAERRALTPWSTEDWGKAKTWILKIFPFLGNFTREFKFGIQENKKILTFEIVDTEKHTDSIMPPGVADFQLKQNLSSDIESGFLKWDLTYTGSITALNDSSGIGISKQLAWFWLWKIILRKRNEFYIYHANLPSSEFREFSDATKGAHEWLFPETPEGDKGKKTGSTPERLTREMTSALMYPVYISFTDDIYGNEVDFTVTFTVITTSSLLIQALKIFEPIREDIGFNKDTWLLYRTNAVPLESTGALPTNPLPPTEVLVDICNPLVDTEPTSSYEKHLSSSEVASIMEVSRPKTGKDWQKYENKFEFVEKHHNYKGQRVKPTGSVQDWEGNSPDLPSIINSNGPTNKEGQMNPFSSPVGSGSESGALREITNLTPVETTRYVIMEGYAERFSGPIAPPKLVAVGNAAAIADSTLGLDVVTTEIVKTAMIDSDNRLCDLFRTTWKKHYVLDRIPTSQTIFTTGVPRRFS